jgi:C1A family cysteine protease
MSDLIQEIRTDSGKLLKGGLIPDRPDNRDYTMKTPIIYKMYQRLGVYCGDGEGGDGGLVIPPQVDISEYCSPIVDQGSQNSCTANAASGLVEYFERRAHGTYIRASRKFIYKTTRNLEGTSGDDGATLRGTLGSLVIFGAPPEKYWPYSSPVNSEPTAFVYALGGNYQTIKYANIAPTGTSTSETLYNIKANITSGIPVIFGFSVFSSISSCDDGYIKYPLPGESSEFGHAVMAVGFHDSLEISNGSYTSVGAIYIRNSWGTDWGIDGYGWLPYDYVTNNLAHSYWVVLDNEWIELGQFGIDGTT